MNSTKTKKVEPVKQLIDGKYEKVMTLRLTPEHNRAGEQAMKLLGENTLTGAINRVLVKYVSLNEKHKDVMAELEMYRDKYNELKARVTQYNNAKKLLESVNDTFQGADLTGSLKCPICRESNTEYNGLSGEQECLECGHEWQV